MEQIIQDPIVPPVRPKNWLIESILVTIFCCIVFGVIGIVYAAQVNTKYESGDYEGALRASQEAGRWTKIGFFSWFVIIALYIVGFLIFGLPAFWMGGMNM